MLTTQQPMLGFKGSVSLFKSLPVEKTPQNTLNEIRKETKTYWAHHMSSLFDPLLHSTASVMLQSITFD